MWPFDKVFSPKIKPFTAKDAADLLRELHKMLDSGLYTETEHKLIKGKAIGLVHILDIEPKQIEKKKKMVNKEVVPEPASYRVKKSEYDFTTQQETDIEKSVGIGVMDSFTRDLTAIMTLISQSRLREPNKPISFKEQIRIPELFYTQQECFKALRDKHEYYAEYYLFVILMRHYASIWDSERYDSVCNKILEDVKFDVDAIKTLQNRFKAFRKTTKIK